MIGARRMAAGKPGGMFEYAARYDPGRVPAAAEVDVRLQQTGNASRKLEPPVYSCWTRLLSSQLIRSDDQLPAAMISFERLAEELNIVDPKGPNCHPIKCN